MRGNRDRLSSLNVQIYADGADLDSIVTLNDNPLISGFTTNPSLLKKSGITDYRAFAKEVLSVVIDKPVSFEVIADEFDEMEDQANEISSWADNVYVKIPVMNTNGQPSFELIRSLSHAGVKLNVTAVMTHRQVGNIVDNLDPNTASIISVFAGRIADVGVNPYLFMLKAKMTAMVKPTIKVLWASPRQLYDIFQAESARCDIITVSHELLSKLPLIGKELHIYSQETVKQFYDDAVASGLSLD